MRIAGTSLKPLEVWRPDVTFADAEQFATSSFVTLLRGGAGARVRHLGPRPSHVLVLYEMERCPFSRLVREALSELDLDALIKPCPRGEHVNRAELEVQRGIPEVPFLIDPGTGVKIGEAATIVRYLYERYGNASSPLMMRGGHLAVASSMIASLVRGGAIRYEEPALLPERPLELWNYEGSPYCRLVRERLAALALPHLSRNLARTSPRRAAFAQRFGRTQFPRLYDPNTSAALFESDAILSYLDRTYAMAVQETEAGLVAI